MIVCNRLYLGSVSWESILKTTGPAEVNVVKLGLMTKIDAIWITVKGFSIKLMLPFVTIVFPNIIVPTKPQLQLYEIVNFS